MTQRRGWSLAVGGLALVVGGLASAQTNQIKPRVVLMVDTSGSMTENLSNNNTGADGSTTYKDSAMSRDPVSTPGFLLGQGYTTFTGGTLTAGYCAIPPTSGSYLGNTSKMFFAKQAVSNVLSGAGEIDWGLMRYGGTYCPIQANPLTKVACGGGCSSQSTGCNANNHCGCTNDDGCNNNQFCVDMGGTDGKICVTNGNLCHNGAYGHTDYRGSANCRDHGTWPVSFSGSGCGGTTQTVAQCATQQSCVIDTDCTGGTVGSGRCSAPSVGAPATCTCSGNADCPTNWTCTTGRCVYNTQCLGPDGAVLIVDPSTPSSNNLVLPWVDGVEDYNGTAGTTNVANPELRAISSTPLAASAREATQWYNNIKTLNLDPQITCRPYILVQLTDGADTCESGAGGNADSGPAAAAASFVNATVANAKNPNKVYAIGLSISAAQDITDLNAIAQMGGTGSARFANSQSDIEAALADIVASSVLVEKCNGVDDNCNGQCDENFPGVAVSGATCSNQHVAATCDNGWPAATHCYNAGAFQCSSDQLSQVCSAQSCVGAAGAAIDPTSGAGVLRLTNVNGLAPSSVGQLLYVSGATNAANNGAFVISAVGATTADVTDAARVVPDNGSITYGLPSQQGAATIAVVAGGSETLTLTSGSVAGIAAGDTIWVTGAATASYNGSFTVVSASGNIIVFAAKAGAPTGSGSGLWLVPKFCPGAETCNGLDDDCDGIIDNCAPNAGISGSCCSSNCPSCAKPPFIETCNGCDDDCDGTVDNHLVDIGLGCGTSVGDCAPGATLCCKADPALGACVQDQTQPPSSNLDKLWCNGGNPGYPKPADLCDGTDDNCNGVSNDNPPQACYIDQASGTPFNPALAGKGACHAGTQSCQTVALAPPTLCAIDSKYHCPPPGGMPCTAGVVWPQTKSCPNPVAVYGACTGGLGPHPEFCDGIDNDCNLCIDDNVQDAWLNQDCCPSGNLADCMNTSSINPAGMTVTGTRCKTGKWQCFQAGGACTAGAKTCVGAVAKTLETCNMVDDDCNGQIDDVPGVNTPCTGPGIYTAGACKALLECVANNMPPQCVQTVMPTMETCNGLDDNCNGQIDDTNPPLAPLPPVLPGVGVACQVPMAPADKPPCKAGLTVCIAGAIQCQGAVGPMPNQCNGISTDCTGQPNSNGNCPTGYACYQGNCVAACQAGEFPCPGGYACDLANMACDPVPPDGTHPGCCVPDECAKLTCPAGFTCKLDANGKGQCIDPCLSVTCPNGYLCKLGACVDASCRTQGCPSGEICVANGNNMFACQPDPCADVTCMGAQFCKDGVCVGACIGPCPMGQFCDKGQCAPDPCAHVPCIEGQVCVVTNGVGACVENQCQFGCGIGQACCGGACVTDRCENLHCPEDTHCTLTSSCDATCETNPASPKDQIVGAGGGGFGCAVGGTASSSPASAALLLMAFGAVVVRRKRRQAEVQR